MIVDFLKNATINTFKGFGNTLFNGFNSDLSKQDKTSQVGLQLAHFKPINQWEIKKSSMSILGTHTLEFEDTIDKSTGNKYCEDSKTTIRLKCAALFAASLIVQPIGLTLNLLNRIGKIVTFAQLWSPSKENYDFKARLSEWGKDLLLVVATPLILVGMIFSAFYGAVISPYDGRKLYGTFERLAYSGGYQFFKDTISANPHNYLLAPCFQPEPKAHLGGGEIGRRDAW